MRERPILFSSPMVRAILDGTKTQTRRVVKVGGEMPPPWATFAKEGHTIAVNGTRPTGLFYWSEEQTPGEPLKKLRRWPISKKRRTAGSDFHAPCPYGQPGDRLWVRETWAPCPDHRYSEAFIYGADRIQRYEGERWTWKPSIHMPRRASRLTLTITDVRVERLQEISEVDAEAEGVAFMREHTDIDETLTAVQLYAALWDTINGEGSWLSNPWVWVVSFSRAQEGK